MKIFIISLLILSSLVFYCQGRLECSKYHPCNNGGRCDNSTGICYCPQTYFGELCEHQNDCHRKCPDQQVCVRKFNQTVCDKPQCSKFADIFIILDSSSTISKAEFNTMLITVEKFIDHFDIAIDKIRVGIFAFNDYIKNETIIRLKDTVNKTIFIQKIKQLVEHHTGGGTRTDNALRFTRTDVFTPGNGDRNIAPNIVLLFTDGQSNKPLYTKQEVDLIKQTDIHMIPIGIGDKIDKQELEMIATKKENVILTNFTALTSIVDSLVLKTCNSSINPCYSNPCKNNGHCHPFLTEYICNCESPYVGANCETKCDIYGDIMIVIDESGSITQEHYDKIIDAVIFFIKSVDINNGKVRIGLITYALDVFVHYDLDAHDNKLDMIFIANILRNKYKGGPTFTHKALRYLREQSFTPSRGDRKDFPNYVLIFTDGASRYQWMTRNHADKLQRTGAIIYAVGVGPKVNKREIYNIASQPKQNHMVLVSFIKLELKMRIVLGHICCDLKPRPPCMKCHRRCKCYPGMKCCNGCCEDTVTIAS